MRLAELSAAWNRLRDRALGRAASPSTSITASLAKRIGEEFNAWRTWYLAAGSLEDVVASATAHEWVSRYNVLAAELTAEGLATASLDTLIETTKKAGKRAADAAMGALEISPIVLLAAAWLYFSSKRR